MTLKELAHHVRPTEGRWAGVFDEAYRNRLEPNFHEIETKIVPQLLKQQDTNGNLIYPWLTKRELRRKFVKYWLESYRAFLASDLIEIPDYDPITGAHNQGHLCKGCQNWEMPCKKIVYKAPFNPFD